MNYVAASANGALDPQTRELVYIAVNASPTALNTFSMELHIKKALDFGVTVEQIMEVFELVACRALLGPSDFRGGGLHDSGACASGRGST